MGALEDFEHRVSGLEFRSPDDLDAWLESTVLPKKHERVAKAISAQWRTKLSNSLVARLTKDADAIKERAEKTLESINEGITRTLEVKKLGAAGRMSSAAMLKEIASLARQKARDADVQQSLHGSVERWEALSDGTAEDFAASRQERFPVLDETLRLTGAMLAGEEESPFSRGGD